MDELEEMRTQLSALKDKLDKETIISNRLLREVTKQKMSHINRNIWFEGACCLFVITFGSYYFRHLGFSWWFVGATILMMIGCFMATILSHRMVKEEEIMMGNLKVVAEQVSHLRQFYKDWIKIGCTIISIWGIWLGIETYYITADWKAFLMMLLPMVIGGIAGGAIGFKINHRLTDEMEEIVRQLNEE